MNSSDWILIRTISQEGSITKAAERLFLSQPSLTYRLNRLEKEFGTKILFRYSNGVSFTPQGEHLLNYSIEMIEQLEKVKQEIGDMEGELQGVMRLGVSTTFAKYNLAPIMKIFKGRYPSAQIELITGSSTLELSELQMGKDVDIIIRRGDIAWPGKKHILMEEAYGIISNSRIEISELNKIPWICDESGKITKSDQEFLKWWTETLKIPPPENVMHVNSIETCIQLAAHGLGWTVLPKIHLNNKRGVCFTPIVWPDGHIMTQKTVMLYCEELLLSRLAKAFIDFMLEEFVDHHLK